LKNIPEKQKLREFLERRGIEILPKNPPLLRCPSPDHMDEHPSAVLYEKDTPRVYCPVCDKSWTVIDVAGMLDGLTEYKDMLQAVRDTLNIIEPIPSQPEKSKPKNQPQKNFLPFPVDKKADINREIENIISKKEWGKRVASWKYHNTKSEVIALDIRFEGGEKKKEIITFWYDGKLKWYQAPVFIYNLHKLNNNNLPVIIHEGAKCAEKGNVLPDFIHLSWSGGSGKAQMADWSILKDREVFILPDDDRQKYSIKHQKAGQIKPQNEQPGYKAALKIQLQLPQAKIIKPVVEARNIKPDGADIEEILKIMSPEQLTAYILNPKNIELSDEEPSKLSSHLDEAKRPPLFQHPGDSSSGNSIPFKILGIGDDDKAAFITQEGRFKKYSVDTLVKQKLIVIASRDYWYTEYKNRDGKISWDRASDEMIRISQNRDFNESDIRGRGAWRDGDKFSYHDGVKTIGEWDPKKIYLRLPRINIGINDAPASLEITEQIKETVFRLSFETPADAVRCLSWSVLAPFSGALKYRPAMLLTGASGTGKSVLQSLIIKKLSNFLWIDSTESSVAGVRGRVQKDSCAIFFEEAEKDTEKKKTNVNNIYSLMRANYTDDAPDTLKGTSDGKFVNYKMNSMFGFASIDPSVDSIADENRIFRINTVHPTNGNNWKSIEKKLLNLLSEKNCRAIRALTWQKLKIILALSERIVDAIRGKTGLDYRSSFADAMLASAFMVIWAGNDNPTDKQIENMLDKYYSYQAPDEHRNESIELIDRLMDETIEILHEHTREKITIMECLNRIYYGYIKTGMGQKEIPESDIMQYKLHASRFGIRLVDDSNLAIVNKHHLIMKIINRGPGYNKLFKRHFGFIEGQRNVHFYDGGKPKRCTILKGIIQKKESDLTDDEKLERLF